MCFQSATDQRCIELIDSIQEKYSSLAIRVIHFASEEKQTDLDNLKVQLVSSRLMSSYLSAIGPKDSKLDS